jgi:acyl carrier protein
LLDFVLELLRVRYDIDNVDSTSVLADIKIDSLKLLELLYELEEYSGKDLQELDISNITTIAELIEAVEKH